MIADHKCKYVAIFGQVEEAKQHDEYLHGQWTLTYDSNHAFCDVTDLSPDTKCCKNDKVIERDFLSNCKENSSCCASMPDCVAHCAQSKKLDLAKQTVNMQEQIH